MVVYYTLYGSTGQRYERIDIQGHLFVSGNLCFFNKIYWHIVDATKTRFNQMHTDMLVRIIILCPVIHHQDTSEDPFFGTKIKAEVFLLKKPQCPPAKHVKCNNLRHTSNYLLNNSIAKLPSYMHMVYEDTNVCLPNRSSVRLLRNAGMLL